jgi:hypothetical protein
MSEAQAQAIAKDAKDSSSIPSSIPSSSKSEIALTLVWRLSNEKHKDLVPKYCHARNKSEKEGDHIYYREIIHFDSNKTISDLLKAIQVQSRLPTVLDQYELCFSITILTQINSCL